ncbi:general transcription factor II-I repeat domain-containing protein 2-like [Leuresthes tenuis]|uniref:general transcription factor II-I repeat domain-containing protein 2-like n=1 Tax=Leuresthes tenuis TaxID=355514 RepID=UPI003B50CC62
MAKRKKDEEYRTFQQEWTEEFAFVERAGSAVCLICNDKIASLKRSNIKRHFDTRHSTFASKYPAGDSRKKACQELLCRVQASQQQLRVWTQQGDWNSASFAGALAIVRSGKPFTDGEYAKTFMVDVANELFDDFADKDKIIKRIKDMPLSARTVHDRTIMMADQIEATQVKDINAAPFFSLALDESTDISHVSQFSIIARYVDGDTLREEGLAVLPVKGTTRGEDLFKSFSEFAKEKNLPMDKLISVCTDGAPCMEALCAQMCGEQLGEVMSLVIRQCALVVKSRFAACLSEIRTFLEMKNVEHPELANTEWLMKFYYLVDMTEHLNQLNVKMQGVGNTVLSLQQAVFAFENKLELFIADIDTCRLLHFEKLGEFKDACTASDPAQHLDLQQLAGFTSKLRQSFAARFGEFRERTRLFKFITHPHECAVDSADLSYIPGVSVRDFELQAADLKASDMWNIKSNLRSRLTDGSLNACMKLNLTKYQPDYKAISKTMQHQKSH